MFWQRTRARGPDRLAENETTLAFAAGRSEFFAKMVRPENGARTEPDKTVAADRTG